MLRWLALGAMVVDHVGYAFVEPGSADTWRAVGRVAWPIFAVLLAYNVAVRAVEPRRYIPRLALFTVLAQGPHYLVFGWQGVSIMGTLLLATCLLQLLSRATTLSPLAWLLVPLILGLSTQVEYGPVGVLLVAVVWWAFRTGTLVAWLIAALTVLFVNYPWPLGPWALAALPLALLVSRLPLSLPRTGLLPWVFYPAHLLLIAAVRALA